FYQVLLWNDTSNIVASTIAELKVVDVVPFADAGLSNQVFQALGLSPGDQIHLTDLDNLNYLFAGSQGITDLRGLECARNLYELDLSNDAVTNTDSLSWISSLNYLYLNNCDLQDASFVSTLTNLVWLELSGNQIHSIPDFSQVTGLYWLDINN